jgi:CheY-like chemotaxis protein
MRSIDHVLGSRQATPVRHRPKSNPVSSSRQPLPRTLIVEDELFVAWHLESLLRDLSFTGCAIAADAESAIAKAGELDLDLILMDINLGGRIDGIEAGRRIRETSDVSIVFVTAYSDPATLRRIEQTVPGAPVLAKPVRPHELRTAIAEAMQRRDG